jgi:hypothetical protein
MVRAFADHAGSILVLLGGALVLGALPGAAEAQVERMGLGGEVFLERSRVVGRQVIEDFENDESFGYHSQGWGAISIYGLIPRDDRLRMGGGARYLGRYAAARGGNRNQRFGFGHMAQAYWMGEYAIPAYEKIDLVLGARAGISVLFPDEHLREEIRRLTGTGVWSFPGPRAGWLLGAQVGARRPITDRLFVRVDLLGGWEQLFLFWNTRRVDGLYFQKRWFGRVTRYGAVASIELML